MRIETLLISGRNNHDWMRSSPFCRDLLQNSGRFNVHMTENPAVELGDMGILSSYQLLFMDYNGPGWDETSKANFSTRVRGGAGLCILHAANNACEGWREFEEMCALCWRKGTSHGQYHAFDVKVTDPDHPITRGLPPVIRNHPDELYHNLVHLHEAPYHVIATAFSSKESDGVGVDQPVLVVKEYGKGRIFHCILGHVWAGGAMDTFENPDFQRILLRGCEWAATGRIQESGDGGQGAGVR